METDGKKLFSRRLKTWSYNFQQEIKKQQMT